MASIYLYALVSLTIANAQPFTLSSWTVSSATLGTDFADQMCGYDSNTQELLIFMGGTTLLSYHVKNDQLNTLQSLSISLTTCAACYTQYNDDLYFIENYKFGIFNVNTRAMTYPLSSLQLPVYGQRTCLAASQDGNFLFIVGGSSSTGSNPDSKRSQVSVYDITRNTLSDAPSMNIVRSTFTCNVANNYLYAMGGDNPELSDTIERIYVGNVANIASETWSILVSTMSARKNALDSVTIDKYVYILGGNLDGLAQAVHTNAVERLDTDMMSVNQDTLLPVDMTQTCAAVVDDNKIYIVDKRKIYWTFVSLPTPEPTNHPSTKPTDIPSAVPTANPTLKPTKVPSVHPTLYPSLQPTENPTFHPSLHPSRAPIVPQQLPTLQAVPSEAITRTSTAVAVSRSNGNNEISTTSKEESSDDLDPSTDNAITIIIGSVVSCVIISSLIGIFCLLRVLCSSEEDLVNMEHGANEIHIAQKDTSAQVASNSAYPQSGNTQLDHTLMANGQFELSECFAKCVETDANRTRDGSESVSSESLFETHNTELRGKLGNAAGLSTEIAHEPQFESGILSDRIGKCVAKCEACGDQKEGKTSDEDGCFYCMRCWNQYENEDECLYGTHEEEGATAGTATGGGNVYNTQK